MTFPVSSPDNPSKKLWVFALTAVLFTNFLFFIDEGYYDFRWMRSIGNWIVFPVYAVPIFLCQWAVSLWLMKRALSPARTLACILLGSISGTLLVAFGVFG